MVCLSFEQSVLKNKQTKKKHKKAERKKKIQEGRGEGGLFAKPCCLDFLFCSVFILAWCSYKGPQCGIRNGTEHSVQRSIFASCPGYQRNLCRCATWQPGPCGPSQSQAMTTQGSGRSVPVPLAWEARSAWLGLHLGSGSVCVCMCLPEENCPDLHCGGQGCPRGSCLRCQYRGQTAREHF